MVEIGVETDGGADTHPVALGDRYLVAGADINPAMNMII
jgi:hypothetical protein